MPTGCSRRCTLSERNWSSFIEPLGSLMSLRRAAVTGGGLITPVGAGRQCVWTALREGRSGISHIEDFDTSRLKTTIAGICRDFHPEEFFDEREMTRIDRVSQIALAATEMAIKDSGLTGVQLVS